MFGRVPKNSGAQISAWRIDGRLEQLAEACHLRREWALRAGATLGKHVDLVGLRYSSHMARSELGPDRAVVLWVLLVWPRHTSGTVATTPLDPCARELGARGGNRRRTGKSVLRLHLRARQSFLH